MNAVSRKCREILQNDSRGGSELPPQPVEKWEDKKAYVLLGPPGSGKTTTFNREANRQRGSYVTVRNFLTFDDRPEWHDTTLFIDGLDEARAGIADGRTPLDSIRAKLKKMGRPHFRLSCREADWFGTNDRNQLQSVAPDETITVLRLEPLSDQDVRRILRENLGIDDPENFIASAQNKGLQELLANPQTLKMLAVAVGSHTGWPNTRMEAFDMACRTLLVEHNEEHWVAQPDHGSVSDLMNASGRLCAIQLLTGTSGYYLRFDTDNDRNFLGLDQIPGKDRAILRNCLQSKLFKTLTQHRTVPVHRQIAEFLAANYLAVLVRKGLPVGRILALITGHDSVVVSELRGLSAWLAAHSNLSRAEVIERDPLGTVLYGDAQHFSPKEKGRLLHGLKRETAANPRLIVTVQSDSRLGDLVSSDMADQFREFLTNPSRQDSWQSFIVILLEALQDGEPLPELADPLMNLIRDASWWPRIRHRAIDAFVQHRGNDEKAFAELKVLTTDVYAGKIPDPDDALLGCLLYTLYPEAISETEVMHYLRVSRKPSYCPEYESFWNLHLPKSSTRNQLALLLDQLAEHYAQLLSKEAMHGYPAGFLRRLPTDLLERFLCLSEDDVDLTHLFHWLGPVVHAVADGRYCPDNEKIRGWLERRPAAWKTLLIMSLKHCIGSSECFEPYHCMYQEEHDRLLRTEPPSDFAFWCLDQAILAEDERAAEWLLGEIAICLHCRRFDDGLSRDVVSGRLAGYSDLQDIFDQKLAELEAPVSDMSVSERRAQTKQPNWHDQVKPHENELRGNMASSALLHELAGVYFGKYLNVRGDSPRDRLNALLANDESLVEAVLSGFRRTIERDDLPSDTQIIRLGTSNRTHPLAHPFMAGLEEIPESALSGETEREESRLRLALAVHYTVPMWPTARPPENRSPRWFSWLLSNRPEVVADMLVRTILSKLRNGVVSPAGLHKLAHSPDYARVAPLATMPLLKRFPVRCTSDQLSSLDHLLLAARQHYDIEPLLELIERKLAHRDMNVAQRVHWLAAGLCIAPDSYIDRLDSYATGKERRIRFLAEAVSRQFHLLPDLQHLRNVPALLLLIRLIGASCRPYSLGDASHQKIMVGLEMNAADRVRDFIEQLAIISSADATKALDVLSSNNALRPWRSFLIDATYRQKAIRREAEFRYYGVIQVLDTLDRKAPANAADLAALTFEHLNEIANHIRNGNTSDWRQYWNVDGHNRPQNTRPEPSCRDALLPNLKSRLAHLGINVEAEGRYANDKRADIRVSHHDFNVPIEVKKSSSQDLWSAIRSPLIAKYVIDSGTGGHGIYLVFWFGDRKGDHPTPPETGPPPGSPGELADLLKNTLLNEEQLKIRVCVIDVSIPPAK